MDSSEVTLKLIKRNGATFLSSTIGSVRRLCAGTLLFPCPWHFLRSSPLTLHFVALYTTVCLRRPQFSSSGATRPIVQEMPVSIRPAEDIALVEPPALETPDVAIYMPDIKTLRAVVERMKSLRLAQRVGSGISHVAANSAARRLAYAFHFPPFPVQPQPRHRSQLSGRADSRNWHACRLCSHVLPEPGNPCLA